MTGGSGPGSSGPGSSGPGSSGPGGGESRGGGGSEGPRLSPRGREEATRRRRRAAASLRENLGKRKAQKRARGAGEAGPAADRRPGEE